MLRKPAFLKFILTDGLEMAELGEDRVNDLCNALAKAPTGFIKDETLRAHVFNELYSIFHSDDYNDEVVKIAATALRQPMITFFLAATKAHHSEHLLNREPHLAQILYFLFSNVRTMYAHVTCKKKKKEEAEKWKSVVANEYK